MKQSHRHFLLAAAVIPLIGLAISGVFRAERATRDRIRPTNAEVRFSKELSHAYALAHEGFPERGTQALRAIDLHQLEGTQLGRWYAAAARIHYIACRDIGVENVVKANGALGTKYFNRAIDLAVDNDERRQLRLTFGQFYLLLEQWENALAQFSSLNADELTADDRCNLLFDWSETLIQLGHWGDASVLARQIADACADSPRLPDAQLKAADILVEASKALTDNSREDDQAMWNDAEALYNAAAQDAGEHSSARWRVKSGRLRIALLADDRPTAYRLANDLLNGTASAEPKVAALIMLTDYEKAAGNDSQAIRMLQGCLERFPDHPNAEAWTKRLYLLYRDIGKPADGLKVVASLPIDRGNPDLAETVLADLCPRLPDLSSVVPPPWNYKRVQEIASRPLQRGDPTWRKARYDAHLVSAMNAYHAKRYREAEEVVAHFPGENQRRRREILSFIDVACAREADRGPAIVARRAERYLNEFPDGVCRAVVTDWLLSAYYKMALYRRARDLAQSSFLQEVAEFATDENSSNRWAGAMLYVALCHDKLGDAEKANLVFRMWSGHLRNRMSADVFDGWAHAAATRQQYHEAVRRYDEMIAAVDEHDAVRARTRRYPLTLKAGLPNAVADGHKLLNELRGMQTLTTDERHQLMRTVYEALLSHAANSVEQTRDLTQRATADFGNQEWIEYWQLQNISQLWDPNDIKALGEVHKKLVVNELGQDSGTGKFLQRQVALLDDLRAARKRMDVLENERLK